MQQRWQAVTRSRSSFRVLRALVLTLGLAGGAAWADEPTGLAAPHYGPWGFDLAGRDLTVRPGRDFNLHSSGAYYRATPIPPDKVAVGGLVTLEELSEARLLALVRDEAAAPGGEAEHAEVGHAFQVLHDGAEDLLDGGHLREEGDGFAGDGGGRAGEGDALAG